MNRGWLKRENIPLAIAAAVVLAVVLAYMAPAEATLGEAVKLVYVHAALMWVGFGMLTLGGLAGLLSWFWRRGSALDWSYGFLYVGLGLLLATGVLGTVTAKITWGAVFWGEPRLAMLGEILAAGAVTVAAGKLSNSEILAAGGNLAFAAVAWVLVLRTELVIHPASPIFSSESAAIRVFPLLITVVLAAAGLLAVRYLAED